MTDATTSRAGPGPDGTAAIVVVVTRTGGIAGMRREWRAAPGTAEAARWTTLVRECPWDDPPARDGGADRFQWTVEARCGEAVSTARLGDGQVTGPWRTLVDAVRGWADAESPRR